MRTIIQEHSNDNQSDAGYTFYPKTLLIIPHRKNAFLPLRRKPACAAQFFSGAGFSQTDRLGDNGKTQSR